MSSRTSSESRDSDNAVNPTRSANKTETSRRSASGGAGGPAGAGTWASGVSAAPHSPQKRSPGSLSVPQAGQSTASGRPQLAQNLRPSRFSVPQFGQFISILSGDTSHCTEAATGTARLDSLGSHAAHAPASKFSPMSRKPVD